MAAEGQVVIRIYNFDPLQWRVGSIGLYLEASSPSAIYSSDLPLVYASVWTGTSSVSGFYLMGDSIPPDVEALEIEYIPIVGGNPQPIDPFDPPPQINIAFENNYAGGVVELGVYLDGQYASIGSREFTSNDYNGVYQIDLYPAEKPATPAFWTGFQRTIEMVDGVTPPPELQLITTHIPFPDVSFDGIAVPPIITSAASDGALNAVLLCAPSSVVWSKFVLCTTDGGASYHLRSLPCVCSVVSYSNGVFILSGAEQSPFVPAVVVMESPLGQMDHILCVGSNMDLRRIDGAVLRFGDVWVSSCTADGNYAAYSYDLTTWTRDYKFIYGVERDGDTPCIHNGYVWFSSYGVVVRSPDGIHYQEVETISDFDIRGSEGIFEIGELLCTQAWVPDAGFILAYSEDGVFWEEVLGSTWVSYLAAVGDYLVAVDTDGPVAMAWSDVTLPPDIIEGGYPEGFSYDRRGANGPSGQGWLLSHQDGKVLWLHRAAAGAEHPPPTILYP